MLGFITFILTFLSFGIYFIFQVLAAFSWKSQDLKTKYGAKWALVTGSSSGIGKSLAWKLASQGLNIVLVSLPEALLEATADELRSAFPDIQVIVVGVDLSGHDYMGDIKKATDELDVQCVFNNAGYMVTGFFHNSTLESQEKNLHCNVTSCVRITHHFVQKMVEKKLKGCVVFTSSPAGFMPGPFAAMYASTKSFLSMFGASIAAEVKPLGIEVLVFHPSPIASRFYDNQKKIDILEFFKGFAASADSLPDKVFACIGRTIWADVGITATVFRLVPKILDFNALATLTATTAHTLPDYKRHSKAE